MSRLNAFVFCVVSVLLSSTSSYSQTPNSVFDSPELLCLIEVRSREGVDHATNSILCDPDRLEDPFFLLGELWKEDFIALPGCDCDLDLDGLTACEELLHCTDPGNNDSDGDCLGDGLEVELGYDPRNSDSDGNGTSDGLEDLDQNGILNRDEDFDQDTLTNCDEVMLGLNPINQDTDGDLLSDGDEMLELTDPSDSDSDDDGFLDGEEVEFESDPLLDTSKPVDLAFQFTFAIGYVSSLMNSVDPTGDPITHTMGPVFSIENQTP